MDNKQDPNEELISEIETDKEKQKKKSFFKHLQERLQSKDYSIFQSGLKGVFDEYEEYKGQKERVIEKYTAYETVVAGTTDTIEYYVLIILSCLIATVGLYQNSPAVIIGAMIVAPLMGPIFGFSAGLLWGSKKVIWEAVTTLFKGIFFVITISALMSFFIPGITVTDEMISRCYPSLFDTIIAISCGFIGAYAYINKRILAAIPGVAVSVALMPPLCTVGIGLGLIDFQLAQGAALLFGINLIGISFAALIVFYLVKLHPQAENKKESFKIHKRAIGQILISLIFLCLIGVPLLFFTIKTARDNIEKDKIINVINEYIPQDRVFSLNVRTDKIPKGIDIVLFSEKSESYTWVEELEQDIESVIDCKIKLSIFLLNQIETDRLTE